MLLYALGMRAIVRSTTRLPAGAPDYGPTPGPGYRPNPGAWLGSALIGLGLLVLLYAAGMYADLLPGSRVTVPRPPALDRVRTTDGSPALAISRTDEAGPVAGVAAVEAAGPSRSSAAESVGAADAVAASEPVAPPIVAAAPTAASPAVAPPGTGPAGLGDLGAVAAAPSVPAVIVRDPLVAGPGSMGDVAAATVLPMAAAETGPAVYDDDEDAVEYDDEETDPAVFDTPMLAADAADRVPEHRIRPPAGLATALRIPAIQLATKAVPAEIVVNGRGEPEWPTLPFVAAHYVDTAPVGGPGNAVISGHVVTINEGNVFRNLYKVDVGQTVEVDTESGMFTYVVEGLKLVPPEAVEVMDPTPDATLTLITCGGEFNPRTRQFSHRLVVTAKLGNWAQGAGS